MRIKKMLIAFLSFSIVTTPVFAQAASSEKKPALYAMRYGLYFHLSIRWINTFPTTKLRRYTKTAKAICI